MTPPPVGSGSPLIGSESTSSEKKQNRKRLLIALAVLVTLGGLAVVFGGGSETTNTATGNTGNRGDRLEVAATDILWDVYGSCFGLPGGKQALTEAADVSLSSEIQGVVTVKVYLRSIATGKDQISEFRINTGLGSYQGIPQPGFGIANNDAARQVVQNC